MRMLQRSVFGAAAILLVGSSALLGGCASGRGTTTGAVAHDATSATATDTLTVIFTPAPATDTPTGPAASATDTPVPPPPPPTDTPVPPTPTDTPIPPTPTPAVVTIMIASSPGPGSFPATITIAAGTHLLWHNASSSVPHTATSSSGPASFDTGNIPAGSDSTQIILTVPGTYTYHCNYHLSMTGQIIVT